MSNIGTKFNLANRFSFDPNTNSLVDRDNDNESPSLSYSSLPFLVSLPFTLLPYAGLPFPAVPLPSNPPPAHQPTPWFFLGVDSFTCSFSLLSDPFSFFTFYYPSFAYYLFPLFHFPFFFLYSFYYIPPAYSLHPLFHLFLSLTVFLITYYLSSLISFPAFSFSTGLTIFLLPIPFTSYWAFFFL